MDDMRELVTVEQAEHAIRLVAVVLPVLGVAVGAVIGAMRQRAGRGAVVGLVCGASGPGLWLLWRMYNGVIGIYGLDSVKGLLINLALFVVIGVGIGTALGLLRRRQSKGAIGEK